jgi:hypothetical protein
MTNEESEKQMKLSKLTRKVLLFFATSPDITDFNPGKYLAKTISITDDELKQVVQYMYKFNLVTQEFSTTVTLTGKGISIAQNIGNDNFWNEAMKICAENNIYSFDFVCETYLAIAKREIQKAVTE